MTLHLEPAIELVDRSSKVDALPLSKELAQLGPLLQAKVVSHEVSVDAVFATLLGVVQDIRGCVTWAAGTFGIISGSRTCHEQCGDFLHLGNSPSALICSYFFLAMNLLQHF